MHHLLPARYLSTPNTWHDFKNLSQGLLNPDYKMTAWSIPEDLLYAIRVGFFKPHTGSN